MSRADHSKDGFLCSAWPELEERSVLLEPLFWTLTLHVTLLTVSSAKKPSPKAEQRRWDAVPEPLLTAVLNEG